MSRRAFLKKTIKAFALVLSATGIAAFSVFTYPGRIRKKKLEFFYACSEDKLPVRGVRSVYLKYSANSRTMNSRAFIVNTGDELFALSPVCTHLGCLVNWNRWKNNFLCPCHGGQYDIKGRVVKGPPPAPLNRLPMRVQEGKVLIGMKV